ncbi:unnamed protein product [Albugo candida]|uniref:RING-type domain-containing protein n=1 Tax=Albugo candida TaxID=65357 RepID=A0A024G847_9STRA|nr:unnamed protein product [Albugo candida]|eukprot:CCI42893.1 unnamed protein product [Albugo candida]
MPLSTLVKYTNEPVRLCDRCVQEQRHHAASVRRQKDLERARARHRSVIEQEAAEWTRKEQEKNERFLRNLKRLEIHVRNMDEEYPIPNHSRGSLIRTRSVPNLSGESSHAWILFNKHKTHFLRETHDRICSEMMQCARYDNTLVGLDKNKPAADVLEECAICLENMEHGNAILTTACGHNFHWHCLKEIQGSTRSNYEHCPSCRSEMKELKLRKDCEHPRVRIGHRFCRDCGEAVRKEHIKPRTLDPYTSRQSPALTTEPVAPSPSIPPISSYRSGIHGALVQCPQCQIQMRVLPHMFNMRVACPSGHVFLVQVAGSGRNGSTGDVAAQYGAASLFGSGPLPPRSQPPPMYLQPGFPLRPSLPYHQSGV